jgi:DNA-binding SARP family transcriptional activator/Tfp pilus assembly protein PilF
VKEVATVIRLRLFGSVELKDSRGDDIGALLTRPKRLALLAYLAANGSTGYTRRDDLLARFWPELDGARARNALNQSVRTIRQALGAAALQSRGDDEIRVDPDVVRCDVVEFRAAITLARHDEALALYRGELLHGFFAPNAAGFEEWLEHERTVLRRAAACSARALAEAHDVGGDLTSAVRWARRAVELSERDERALRHFLELLDRLGDRAGALEAYEVFAQDLRDDLDVAPSTETMSLANCIRGQERTVAAEPRVHESLTPATGSLGHHDDLVPHVAATVTASARPGRRMRIATAAFAMVVVASAGVSFARSRAPRRPAASMNRVAVFPIQVHAGADLQYLSQGTMVLLEQALDGVGDLRRVDPNALASRLGPTVLVVSAEKARTVATGMGAGRWILGNIVQLGGGIIRLSLSLYDARWRTDTVATAAAEDSLARIDELVKTTLTKLLGAQQVGGGARLKLNPGLTPHFEALKAYLQAEASLRRGEHDAAARLLERAVAIDSEFALAWYRLSFARNFIQGVTGLPEGGLEAVREAMRYQTRLSERDRRLVAIYHALVHGDGRLAEEGAKEFTRIYPDEAEGWTTLAIVQIWHSWQRGRDIDIADGAYQRAVAVDPEHRDARFFLARIAMGRRDYATLDSIIRAGAAPGSPPIGGNAAALVSAFGQRDAARQRELIAALSARPSGQLLPIAINVAKHTDDLEGAARIARLMTDSAATPAVRKQGRFLLALLLIARGQRTKADAELSTMAAIEGDALVGYDVLFRAWFAATPALAVPAADLRRIRDTLERWPPSSAIELSGPPWYQIQWSLGPGIRLYLLGLVCARLGDQRSALRHASTLERLRIAADSAHLLTDLALEIRALVSAEAGRDAEALSIIERQKLTVRWMYDIHDPLYFRSFGRLLRADLLRRTGRHDEALAWYSAFAWSASPEFVYLAPVNLGQARSLERLGRPEDAATYYRRFIARWHDADSDLQHEVSRARASLMVLERQLIDRR